jgi:hypothetical protein
LVSFIKFIPRYFIVFEAIVNGIVSLISFSVCLLLVYRKTTDFILILQHDTLPIGRDFESQPDPLYQETPGPYNALRRGSAQASGINLSQGTLSELSLEPRT